MRTLCALLLLVAASSGEHVSYSAQSGAQKGLLVLPKQGPTLSTTSTTPAPRNNKENLEDVSAKISERLRQEQGSQQGEYHVYLQDGRLQKVQYTTAPVTSGQQQLYASNNYNQQQQAVQQAAPEILSPEFAEKRGVYFVQVPQERIQQLKSSYNQQISQQSSQTAQGFNNFQFSQQNAQTNFQFPDPQPSSSRYTEPQDYLAKVQFSPVEPITGPVYSYKPQPLTRILRYAPAFY
ncbi:uncharacterized protein [Halyomorpha halys]|uniref:uncharacterized protein n=1 Tax=Halyomorpha halys TaxID=286706 RepID=UPI0006D4FA0E